MKYIDNFLNGITMYKVVLYGLSILALLSIILGFLGVIQFGGLSLLITLLVLFIACFVTNTLFAELFKVQTNVESVWITAFILFFVLFPVSSVREVFVVALVAVVSMASKYLLAINKKHIFNPVAISIFLAGLFGSGAASWWIGSSVMILPVAVLGFLVLRKLKRFQMFSAFILASLFSICVFNYSHLSNIGEILKIYFVSGPILFFGAIMLTEPLTTPPTKKLQLVYAVLVGLFFGAQFDFGFIYATPGLALVIGNIFSYLVSPKSRLVLNLVNKNQLTKDVYEFVFEPDSNMDYKPGQYLEWTLGHSNPDQRGNRRYFTIASSPTEKEIKLGVKFYDNSSSFKKKLLSLEKGDKVIASQLSGEFTLPENKEKKFVFIAGGIGVTPFRSMIKNMVDKQESRDVVFFFSNRTADDIVYKDIFDQAKNLGVKTLYAVGSVDEQKKKDDMRVGFVDENMIKTEAPDYKDRVFYISGPHSMITAFEATLSKMGVKSSNIKTDFFPGFV